jgi:hypothetical protein
MILSLSLYLGGFLEFLLGIIYKIMSHLKGIQEIREKILQRKKAMEAASQKASL